MSKDWVYFTVVICFGLYYIVLPMFNAYLEYKLNCKQMEDIPNEPLPQSYREVENEKGLQRDNDESDSSERIGQSVKGTPIHDEELPL